MYNFNEDAIRTAAYFIWKNNGCQQGTALKDWDEAIHQLSLSVAFAPKGSKNAGKGVYGTNPTKPTVKKVSTPKAKSSSLSKAGNTVKAIVLNPVASLKTVTKTNKK